MQEIRGGARDRRPCSRGRCPPVKGARLRVSPQAQLRWGAAAAFPSCRKSTQCALSRVHRRAPREAGAAYPGPRSVALASLGCPRCSPKSIGWSSAPHSAPLVSESLRVRLANSGRPPGRTIP
jgi:hypothetical protein